MSMFPIQKGEASLDCFQLDDSSKLIFTLEEGLGDCMSESPSIEIGLEDCIKMADEIKDYAKQRLEKQEEVKPAPKVTAEVIGGCQRICEPASMSDLKLKMGISTSEASYLATIDGVEANNKSVLTEGCHVVFRPNVIGFGPGPDGDDGKVWRYAPGCCPVCLDEPREESLEVSLDTMCAITERFRPMMHREDRETWDAISKRIDRKAVAPYHTQTLPKR